MPCARGDTGDKQAPESVILCHPHCCSKGQSDEDFSATGWGGFHGNTKLSIPVKNSRVFPSSKPYACAYGPADTPLLMRNKPFTFRFTGSQQLGP